MGQRVMMYIMYKCKLFCTSCKSVMGWHFLMYTMYRPCMPQWPTHYTFYVHYNPTWLVTAAYMVCT